MKEITPPLTTSSATAISVAVTHHTRGCLDAVLIALTGAAAKSALAPPSGSGDTGALSAACSASTKLMTLA
jgi:hypothetical protein